MTRTQTSYSIGHIVGVEVYAQDTVVIRDGGYANVHDVPRGAITHWSRKSRMRLAFVASNTTVTFRTMITLTYPREYPTDGQTVKAHLHSYLVWLGRDTGGTSYLWFLEFQQRGAPHFHILIDWPLPVDRRSVTDARFRTASTWYRICATGDERHLAAGTRVERIRRERGARNYAVKYAFKMRQKTVPTEYQNVGRLWGASRDVMPKPVLKARCTEDDVRGVLVNWPYKPADDRAVYTVLYNTASLFTAAIRGDEGDA